MSLARPVATRATRGGPNRYPIWSPDGAHILSLFQGRGIGTFDLVTTSVATGDVETVRQHTVGLKPVGWTRDGWLVWFEYGFATGPGATIWTRPANGQPVPVLRDGDVETPRVSPDGRWIALPPAAPVGSRSK
jgi:Tol biopolymer transport system component